MCIRDSQTGTIQNLGSASAPKDLTVSLTGNAAINHSTVILGNASGAPMISPGQVLTLSGTTSATLNNATLNPVSYTHLDVYKRQSVYRLQVGDRAYEKSWLNMDYYSGFPLSLIHISRLDQVRAVQIEILVDQEILLFRPQRDGHAFIPVSYTHLVFPF